MTIGIRARPGPAGASDDRRRRSGVRHAVPADIGRLPTGPTAALKWSDHRVSASALKDLINSLPHGQLRGIKPEPDPRCDSAEVAVQVSDSLLTGLVGNLSSRSSTGFIAQTHDLCTGRQDHHVTGAMLNPRDHVSEISAKHDVLEDDLESGTGIPVGDRSRQPVPKPELSHGLGRRTCWPHLLAAVDHHLAEHVAAYVKRSLEAFGKGLRHGRLACRLDSGDDKDCHDRCLSLSRCTRPESDRGCRVSQRLIRIPKTCNMF